MRITVLALGTRGDVYPMTALAAELARRGHQVRLGVSPNLMDAGRKLGLDTVPIGWDTQQALASSRGQAWINATDPHAWIRNAYAVSKPFDEKLDGEVIGACSDSDAIVAGIMLKWRAAILAKARGIPLVVQDVFPNVPNDVVPHPLVTLDPQPSDAATRATYHAFTRMNSYHLSEPIARFRARVSQSALPPGSQALAPRHSRPLALQTYSPSLVPGLKLGAGSPIVGDMRMSRADQERLGMSRMDPGVMEWLDSGDPPGLFAFGSTHLMDPADMLAVIGRVCRSQGLRGLVVTGMDLSSSDLAQAREPDLRLVSFVDYDTVLSRCALAVHHGGATVSAAALRAGIPAMICSVSYDQPFWGTQVERLGAGRHVRQADVTEDVLRAGIRHVMTEPLRRRAAHLGAQMRAEPDGTLTAADEIGRYLAVQPGQGLR